jgi:hypothetical protein
VTPAQVRRLASRIDKAAIELRTATAEIPGEAFGIIGHVPTADAHKSPSHALTAAYLLRDNASKFGKTK